MALDENAKATNVVGSIQAYFDDALAAVLNSSSPAIDYGGGLPFTDGPLAEWVQVRTLGPARPTAWQGPYASRLGGADADARGGDVLWLLNVNCFVRPARQSSNLRIFQVRDLVAAAFCVGTRIPVKDYVNPSTQGGETIGYLFVDEISADRPVEDPERTELVQHNLVFAMRWTETWTP